MSHVIWKFPIDVAASQEVEMPAGASILCVQTQDNELHLWASVDPRAKVERITVRVFGTGHTIGDWPSLQYIGTAQTHQGRFVWHVFQEPKP